MKKAVAILLIFTSACSITQSKQQHAEQTVKAYIHSRNPSANIKAIKFTAFDPISNVIGIEPKNKPTYDSNHNPILLRTVYYKLNKDLTKVYVIYTN